MNRLNQFFKTSLTASLILSSASLFAAASEEAAEIALSFERFDESDAYFGFLQENCMECHNYEDWAGSIAFDLMSPVEIADNVATWEKVVLKLRGRLMPPAGAERPDNAETDDFIAWMENYLDHAGAQKKTSGTCRHSSSQ